MSNSRTSDEESIGSNKKRALPSWMSSSSTANDDHAKTTVKRKPATSVDSDDNAPSSEETIRKSKSHDSSSANFSKLLDGVVFALSGFVNPERATLRSQALEMGADYRSDWSSECTLLVCAYANTPKFRQVEADGGTIVKKDWILECYSEKKLVEIDSYLMHAGKPWRKSNTTVIRRTDQKTSSPRKSEKQVKRGSHSKQTAPSSSKPRAASSGKEKFSQYKVKEWAADDLNRTLSWLETREEKPEPNEMKEVAAGGIIICLQDAIDYLEQDQDIRKITEQWNALPRAVEELIKLAGNGNDKEDLCRQAKELKQIYEEELNKLTNDGNKAGSNKKSNAIISNEVEYDTDETIEMTEEEIDDAYNNVASKIH